MSTPRTDALEKKHPSPREQTELCRTLETELAAVTKERDAFRAAFCGGLCDTGETPEQARARWETQAFIDGVSAVIIARELQKELAAERAKVERLRDALPRLTNCYCCEKYVCQACKALAETAPKEETK
jgi:hypothetical protein